MESTENEQEVMKNSGQVEKKKSPVLPLYQLAEKILEKLAENEQFKQFKVAQLDTAYELLKKKDLEDKFEIEDLQNLKVQAEFLLSASVNFNSECMKLTKASINYEIYKNIIENKGKPEISIPQSVFSYLDSMRPIPAGIECVNKELLDKNKNILMAQMAIVLFKDNYLKGGQNQKLEKYADAFINNVCLMDKKEKFAFWKEGVFVFDAWLKLYDAIFNEKLEASKNMDAKDRNKWIRELKRYQRKMEDLLFKNAYDVYESTGFVDYLSHKYKLLMGKVEKHLKGLPPGVLHKTFEAELEWKLHNPKEREAKQAERENERKIKRSMQAAKEKEMEELEKAKREQKITLQELRQKATNMKPKAKYLSNRNAFELVSIDQEGKHLRVRSSASTQQVLFTEPPIVFKATNSNIAICANCFVQTRKGVNQVQCDHWHTQFFCGKPCMKAAKDNGRHPVSCSEVTVKPLSRSAQLLYLMINLVGGVTKMKAILHESQFRDVEEVLKSARSEDGTWNLLAIGLLLSSSSEELNKNDDSLELDLLLEIFLLELAFTNSTKPKDDTYFNVKTDGLFAYKMLRFLRTFPQASTPITGLVKGKMVNCGYVLSPFGALLNYVDRKQYANVQRQFNLQTGMVEYVAIKPVAANEVLSIMKPKQRDSKNKKSKGQESSSQIPSEIQPPQQLPVVPGQNVPNVEFAHSPAASVQPAQSAAGKAEALPILRRNVRAYGKAGPVLPRYDENLMQLLKSQFAKQQ